MKYKACSLAIFTPYQTSSKLLHLTSGVKVSNQSIWNWVQDKGKKAIDGLNQQLQRLDESQYPELESLDESLSKLPLVIGADGVTAPFRPVKENPSGKVVWKEVKVAVVTRIEQRLNSKGKSITQLKQRRLVAVLGSLEKLRPRLWLESLRQGVLQALKVVWISDGARGLWNLFAFCFSSFAIGILDFYHAAENLWKAASAWLDGRTNKAKIWFKQARHQLRRGELDIVLLSLTKALISEELSDSARKAITNLYQYLDSHREHTHYAIFKDFCYFPIGSGMVESSCKWLVTQRFKCSGMRWSEDGFQNLLQLRVDWVNGRFDSHFAINPPKF